jgi:hypothetical protein
MKLTSASSIILAIAGLLAVDSAMSLAKTAPLQLCVDPSNGACSATIQGAVNQVPAGGSAIITVAAGTYPEQITVDSITVSFVGAGPDATIVDATNGASLPAFLFRNGSNGELHSMTIKNGSGGVGGDVQFKQLSPKNKGVGTLKIENCELTGANPGGSTANGTVDFFGAKLIIDSTSITNNADTGINIARGKAFITNTTISGNDLSSKTSGQETGCGISLGAGCSASLDNVTITNNICGGNGSSQGGGIFVDIGATSFSIANTIIAGNSAPIGPDCESTGGVGGTKTRLKSKGFNLIEDVSGCPFKVAKSDVTGTDPQLNSLASCSGLDVQTPMGGSPLIGKGNPGPLSGKIGSASPRCSPNDECGTARTKGSCTIGAVQ